MIACIPWRCGKLASDQHHVACGERIHSVLDQIDPRGLEDTVHWMGYENTVVEERLLVVGGHELDLSDIPRWKKP